MKYLLLLFILFSSINLSNYNQQQATVKYTSQIVDLRSGPGVYYDFEVRILKGAKVNIVEKKERWTKVKFKNYEGWLPNTVLKDQVRKKKTGKSLDDKMDSVFGNMGNEKTTKEDLTASKAEVAAAIKGFAKKYKAKRGISTNVNLEPHLENRINWRDYKKFRKSRIADVIWYHKKEDLQLDWSSVPPHDPTLDKIGYSIATILANDGLVQDYKLQEYLNYMALFVVESSHRYEQPVQVHVLDTDEVSGFAVPGGYIFVSKGALKLMQNEAELAHFLGHEIAHLQHEHGFQEYKRRMPLIKSAKAFSELDQEFVDEEPNKYNDVDKELTSWADEVFEYISKPRLDNYEMEADFWGMVYTFRSGYRPEYSIRYLERLQQTGYSAQAQKGKMEWTGTPLERRIYNLARSLKDIKVKGGKTYTDEFQEMKNRLR